MEVPEARWHRPLPNTRALPLALQPPQAALAQPCLKEVKPIAEWRPTMASLARHGALAVRRLMPVGTCLIGTVLQPDPNAIGAA